MSYKRNYILNTFSTIELEAVGAATSEDSSAISEVNFKYLYTL